MKDFFHFMAHWGIWSITSLIVALIPSILVLIYLFPRRAIKNFYIDTQILHNPNNLLPKVIKVELRNRTNEALYILSHGFTFGNNIKPSPLAAKDAATDVYEIKFEGRESGALSEIDTLVRPNQVVITWIPIEPNQSDQDISEALSRRSVGVLRLEVQRISSRRRSLTKLRIPV